MALFPKLMMSILFGLTATAYAASTGYGIFTCLLIYAAAGQLALLSLVALDLLRSEGRAVSDATPNRSVLPGPDGSGLTRASSEQSARPF